jgi:hypothetical protein
MRKKKISGSKDSEKIVCYMVTAILNIFTGWQMGRLERKQSSP